MSFLHNSVSGFHAGAGNGVVNDGRKRTLRKSQSLGGLLNPLARIAKNPRNAIDELWSLAGTIQEEPTEAQRLGTETEDRKQLLYLRLKDATSYSEWKDAASELDEIEGNNAWKEEEVTEAYDHVLVKSRLQQLDEARISCDVRRMLFLIRTALTRGLGGMGDIGLYKHSHIGTKTLIERYIESTEKTITSLLDISASHGEAGRDGIDIRHLLDQMLQARQSFGRSALLLSGGGTFGMNHIGVVKTLWDAKLLPRIISGASAGSIVAAVLCAKTDEEMGIVVEEFCYGELDVFEKEGEEDGVLRKISRFLKHGSLFDIKNLIRVMRNLLGDLTFQEAYNRTRRILNIPVSTASLYELPRLLNYVTAPNVIIWSAVAASCSVPLVFSAASLLSKDPRTGEPVPWNASPGRWIDGSVDNDLPMTRLAEMFNVNHFIVSQVNPHVAPFVNDEGSSIASGPSWLSNIANLARGEALHRMHVITEMGIFPNFTTKVRSILSQRYAGDINIFPAVELAQLPLVLTNPSTDFMIAAMLGGERATWPKLSRIQNHCAIELALDAAVRQLRARVAFSPSQVDLRQSQRGYPLRPLSSSSNIEERRKDLRSAASYHVTHHTQQQQKQQQRHAHPQLRRRPRPNLTLPTSPPTDPVSSSYDDEDNTSSPFDDADDDDDAGNHSSSSSTESPPSPTKTAFFRSASARRLFPSASQPPSPLLARSFSIPNAAVAPLVMSKPLPPQQQHQQQQQQAGEAQESVPRPCSRRGSNASVSSAHLDISGTRRMMLRRRQSGIEGTTGGLGVREA